MLSVKQGGIDEYFIGNIILKKPELIYYLTLIVLFAHS